MNKKGLFKKLQKEHGHIPEAEEISCFMTPNKEGRWMPIAKCIELLKSEREDFEKKEKKYVKIINALRERRDELREGRKEWKNAYYEECQRHTENLDKQKKEFEKETEEINDMWELHEEEMLKEQISRIREEVEGLIKTQEEEHNPDTIWILRKVLKILDKETKG